MKASKTVLKPKSAANNQNVSMTEESESSSMRTRTKARSKSPGRPPNKSPARSKSPSRKSASRLKNETPPPPASTSTPIVVLPKARSPIRRTSKSPTRAGRTTVSKSTDIFVTERVQRPRRRRLDVDSDSDTPDFATIAVKPQAAVRGSARQLQNLVPSPEVNAVKRVTKSSHTRELERVVHLEHFDSAKRLGQFSDEDEVYKTKKSASRVRSTNFRQIQEFGGVWGAVFFMISTPISMIALLVLCNETRCSFTQKLDLSRYAVFGTYFDLVSVLGFVIYAVTLAVLSVIPFGGRQVTGMATKQGKFVYTMNGFFSCFVLIALALGLEYRNIRIIDFVANHLFHLLIASILFGLALAVVAFIRSFYVPYNLLNAHVLGRNKIYGFFMGRELNPRLFRLLDLKMYVFRLALIGAVLLDFVFLYRTLDWASTSQPYLGVDLPHINSTLAVFVLIHSIYYLDALAFERTFVTSFEIQYEGFGYVSAVGYLIYPFMMSAATKYVADFDVKLPVWELILAFVVFIFGYLLFRGSNNQKNAFRRNPYDPALSHLETIPTTKGKKLICSGFWGIVRHPNYLGDILMNLSFVPFSLQVPPVLSPLSIVLFLIHRSVRDNERCKEKYRAAWDRYCNKVKYVLVPKVY